MIEFVNDVDRAKTDLFIVIFGPYKKGGLQRLKDLKQSLIDAGYSKTSLVNDQNDPPGLSKSLRDDVRFTRKSLYWLERCQVALFVFFNNIPFGSVIVEITKLLTSMPEKIPCASFLIEEGLKLPTLVSGIIRDHDCTISYFETKEDLTKMARFNCLHHLIEDECGQF